MGEKQKSESTECFKVSVCKGVKVTKVDLLPI